jgi:hypothetical protein
LANINQLAEHDHQYAKAANKMNRLEKLFLILVCFAILAYLVSVIIPGNPFFLTDRHLLCLSLALVLIKALMNWRRREGSTFLDVLPFLILFLLASHRVFHFQEYRFGVDDACYYSYVSSVFLDGDLELSNQYKLSKLDRHVKPEVLFKKTPAGYTINIYPVGLSVCWSPFFVTGHLLAKLFNFPLNGYSPPYLLATLVGNLFYVCAGLYFTYRFCSGFFPKLASLISTAAILFTTPYLRYYFHSLFLVSEALSFALIAMFLFLVFISKEKPSLFRWFGIGILFGTLTMVRLQNVILVIVPLSVLYFFLPTERKTEQYLRLTSLFAAGSLIGFLPQLIVWRIMNGEWLFSAGVAFLPYWKSPFVLETLFSARKGLMPWSPSVVLSVTGLFFFIRKNQIWGWSLWAVLLIATWMNSAHIDWWGAASVGARRFVPLCSIFALGIAALFSSF